MAKPVIIRFLADTVGLERGFKRVGDATSGFGGRLGKLTSSLSSLPGPLGNAASSLTGLGGAGGVAAVATAGAAAAFTALAAVAARSVQMFTTLAGQVLTVQRATGATAADASRLVAVLDDFEIPVETASKAFFKLGKIVAAGGDELAGFGVTVATGAGGVTDLSETILSVADAYQATADPAQRAALVTAAFGRAGQDLIPVLEQGRAGLEEMFASAADSGQILDQEAIDRAEQFRLAMDNLSDSTGEVFLAIGEQLVPALTDLADVTSVVVAAVTDFGKENDGAVGTVKKLAAATNGLGLIYKALAFVFKDELAAKRESRQEDAAKARSVADAAAAADQAAQAEADYTAALEATTRAEQALIKANERVADSTANLADARTDLDRLVRDGPDGLSPYQEALADVADADENVADAEDDVAAARRGVTEATDAVTDALAGVVAAEADLLDAHEDVEDAQGRLLDTETRLVELRAEAAEDAKDAAVDISAAGNRLSKAQAAEAAAENRLTQLRAGAETTAAGLAEAEADVADAKQDAAEAARNLEKAEGDLAEADATLVGTSGDVRDADEKRKDAVDAVNVALAGEAAAQQTLLDSRASVVEAETAKTVAVDALSAAETDLAATITARTAAQAVAAAADDTDVAFAGQVADAKNKITVAERGVRDATAERAGVTADLRVRSDEAALAISGLLTNSAALSAFLAAHPELLTQLAPTVAALAAADIAAGTGGFLTEIGALLGGRGDIAGVTRGARPIPGRAAGGSVFPNTPYLVGENGPEIRVFDRDGAVRPTGTAAPTSVTINAELRRGTPREIADELGWLMRTGGI